MPSPTFGHGGGCGLDEAVDLTIRDSKLFTSMAGKVATFRSASVLGATLLCSTCIKNEGITSCHLRGYIVSILQGLEISWMGLPVLGMNTQKGVDPKKKTLFWLWQHIEKWGQKVVLDFVKSIMKPSDPAKGAVRRILFKMNQFKLDPNSSKSGFQLFWCPEN